MSYMITLLYMPPTSPVQPVMPNTGSPMPEISVIKHKKRSSLGFLIVLVVLLILGGIGFFVYKSLSTTKTTSSGEITWWGLWEDEKIIKPLIADFEKSHEGVKINYVRQSQKDYRERLTSAFAKGAGPDIFMFHNSWTPMFRNDFDTLPASVINPADYAKSFYKIAQSDLTVGNGIVGIPLMYDSLAFYINEDIFNKAGKSPPTTWDELRILARQLTVKDDQGIITQSGVALGRTENVDHWPEILALMMIQNGVDLASPIGQTAEDALTYFTIFSTVDGVWDATLPSSTQAFAGGKLAMYFGPSWRTFEIEQANPNLKFKTMPLPQLPKDSPTEPDISYASYWAQGVSSKSEMKSTAWEFVKFMSEKSNLQKFYTNAVASGRGFGEPYPLVEMAGVLADHPILGPIMAQANGARSWYLYSRTFDGPTGINSQMANYFGDAINAVATGKSAPDVALQTVAVGVKQILTQYRLVK